MTSEEFFSKALDQATIVVGLASPDCYGQPCPCDDWNMRQLINHLTYELAWMPDLIDGKTIAEVGEAYEGDLLGEDHVASWKQYAEKGRAALKRVKPGAVAHLSYADKPVDEYIDEVAQDLIVHAWDCAQGLNITLVLDEQMLDKLAELQAKSPNDSFFNRLVSNMDDSPQIQLLGLFGRPSEKWRATLASKIDW